MKWSNFHLHYLIISPWDLVPVNSCVKSNLNKITILGPVVFFFYKNVKRQKLNCQSHLWHVMCVQMPIYSGVLMSCTHLVGAVPCADSQCIRLLVSSYIPNEYNYLVGSCWNHQLTVYEHFSKCPELLNTQSQLCPCSVKKYIND